MRENRSQSIHYLPPEQKQVNDPPEWWQKKAHSTENLNIYLTDRILEAMDGKKHTTLILLDLSKAFESIQHQKLPLKLSKVGASPSTINWFKSYLSGCSQSVWIDCWLTSSLNSPSQKKKKTLSTIRNPKNCWK